MFAPAANFCRTVTKTEDKIMKNDYKPIKPMKEIPDQLRKLRRQFLRYQQAEIVYSLSHKKLLVPGPFTASTAPCLSTGRFLMPIWNVSMSLQEKPLWRRLRTNERQCVDFRFAKVSVVSLFSNLRIAQPPAAPQCFYLDAEHHRSLWQGLQPHLNRIKLYRAPSLI